MERESQPQQETRNVLPENLQVPDLEIAKGDFEHREKVEFPIQLPGVELRGELEFARDTHEEFPGKINLKAYDDRGELVLTFKSNVCRSAPSKSYSSDRNLPADQKVQTHLRIYYRRIESQMRHKGLGEYAVLAMEEAAKKLGQKYSDLDSENIRIDSVLASTSRMIIDQTWLAEHGLEKYKRNSQNNLGYVPHSKDEGYLTTILSSKTEELEDVKAYHEPVRFIKNLKK